MSAEFVAKIDLLSEKSIRDSRRAFEEVEIIKPMEKLKTELFIHSPDQQSANYLKEYRKFAKSEMEKHELKPVAVHNPRTALNGDRFSFTINPQSSLDTAIQTLNLCEHIGASYFNIHPFGGHRGRLKHDKALGIALTYFNKFLDVVEEKRTGVTILPEMDGADPYTAVNPPLGIPLPNKRIEDYYWGEIPDQLLVMIKEIIPRLRNKSLLVDIEHVNKGLVFSNYEHIRKNPIESFKHAISSVNTPVVHVCQQSNKQLWEMNKALYEKMNNSQDAIGISRAMYFLDRVLSHMPATGHDYTVHPTPNSNASWLIEKLRRELPLDERIKKGYLELRGDIPLKDYFGVLKGRDVHIVSEHNLEHMYNEDGWTIEPSCGMFDDKEELKNVLTYLKKII